MTQMRTVARMWHRGAGHVQHKRLGPNSFRESTVGLIYTEKAMGKGFK